MHASRNLLGQSRFLGIWINISCTTYKRRASQGKLFKILLQNTLKTIYQVRIEPIINPQMHINRQIFSKIRAFYSSFNKDRGYLPPPHLLVACLNQFIFLNKFFFHDNIQIQQSFTFDFKKNGFTLPVAATLV